MTMEMKMDEKFEEGKKQGKSDERIEIIQNALRQGNTPEQVAAFLGISLDEVKKAEADMLQGVDAEGSGRIWCSSAGSMY